MDRSFLPSEFVPGTRRWFLPECRSTNEEMKDAILRFGASLPEGFRISSGFQTSGRGQRGTQWHAEPGENLLVSFFYRPVWMAPSHGFWLSAAAALALAETLDPLVQDLFIKWPNDVVVGGKKIAGILVESQTGGKGFHASVIGVGVNVNAQNPFPGATSLLREGGNKTSVEILEEQFSHYMDRWMARLEKEGWAKIRSLYLARLYRQGLVSFWEELSAQTTFQAILKSVTEHGLLVLLTHQGERTYDIKEIRFLPSEPST